MPTTNETRQWYKLVTAKADGGKPKRTVLHVYDVIGADLFFGGVDVNELVAEIEALDDDTELEVRVNSPGGAAWDGLTLASAIQRHPGKTTTHIDGLAASAASVVALAGDQVVMSKYGQMMLHNARFSLMGATVEELADAAKTGAKLNNSLAEYYADRAGGDVRDWAKAMARETWYDAAEAHEAGLATEIDDSAKREDSEAAVAASVAKAKTAAWFRYAGRQDAPPPPTAKGETGPHGPNEKEAIVPISEKVAERLGLGADATDDDVIAKLDELDKGGDSQGDADQGDGGQDTTQGRDASTEGEVAAVKAAAAKLGLTVTDPESLSDLRANAQLGVAAHTELTNRRIATALDDAIAKGRITPALRGKYEALMRKDEAGVTALLSEIPDGTAAPVQELGHSLEPVNQADDITADPRYQAWKF